MKAKNFGWAFGIALAFELLGYDLNNLGIFSAFGSGSSIFFSFILLPLGALVLSWAAFSQIKEKHIVKVSESLEFVEMKKKVSVLENRVASITEVLVKKKIIVENPITESGFRAVHNEYLAPEVKH